ncbi:MAG: nucleotidyltransferase domain-containing protein [Bdellovibrionales bacterium]|nr:nucleotidyltransferase domain-containing protein [Ramlibacter sp.]
MNPVLDQKQKEVADLCRHAGARRLDAFGSVVRADFDPLRSDLDFLVELDNAPPTTYAAAYFELKAGLALLFGRPMDLITDSSLANPYFPQRVTAERVARFTAGKTPSQNSPVSLLFAMC